MKTTTQNNSLEVANTINRIKIILEQIDKKAPFNYYFEVDNYNYKYIENVLEHIEGVSESYPTEKALLLFGSVGSGKSDLMRLMLKHNAILKKDKLYFAHAKNYVFDYEVVGADILQAYENDNIIIDEIGLDNETAIHYGNKTNVIQDLILLRYEIWKDKSKKTYFTTNLTPSELKEKYGERVFSRLIEMCTFIKIDYHQDRRAGVRLKNKLNELTLEEKQALEFVKKNIKFHIFERIPLSKKGKESLLNVLRDLYKKYWSVRDLITESNLPQIIKDLEEIPDQEYTINFNEVFKKQQV